MKQKRLVSVIGMLIISTLYIKKLPEISVLLFWKLLMRDSILKDTKQFNQVLEMP